MAKTEVRKELLSAYSIELAEGESEAELALRVAEVISESEDDAIYEALSKDAKTWYDSAVNAINEDKDVPDLPGDAAPAPAKKAAAPATTKAKEPTVAKKEEVKKAAPTKAAVPAKKAAPAAPAKKAAPAAPAKKAAPAAPAKKAAAPAAKAPKKEKAPKEAKEPRNSVTRVAIEMMCKSPNMSKDDLEQKLADKGLSLGPLPAVYQRTKLALDTLKALGKL